VRLHDLGMITYQSPIMKPSEKNMLCDVRVYGERDGRRTILHKLKVLKATNKGRVYSKTADVALQMDRQLWN
jgi:hypothetical protein